MNIGVDARFYSPSATGIGRHIAEILKELGKLDTQNQYTVFLNEKNFNKFQKFPVNFKAEKTNASHYSLSEQTSFLSQLNKHQFDLMIFPQFNVPFFYKRPFLVTIHDLTIHFFPGKKSNRLKYLLYKKIIKQAAQKSYKILTVSKNTKKDIVKYLSVFDSKISIVGNGVSKSFEKCTNEDELKIFREKYNLPQKYFLYAGVMRTHKNILGLVEAFSLFRKKNKSVELVLAGQKDSLYFPEILKKAKLFGVDSFIHFTGFFPEADFSKLFSASTAFVFPSFYEGFGIPPLEAMSVDVPVVVSKSSSLPEVCESAALYFDPYSPKEIAEKMEKVLKPEVRKHLFNLGKKQWKKFQWKKVGEKYFEAIQDFQKKL